MKQLYWTFVLFCLFCVVSSGLYAGQTDLEAGENLVSLIPDYFFPLKTECQGLRVSKSLIVTSPRCVDEIRKIIKRNGTVEAFDAEVNTIGLLCISTSTFSDQMIESNLFIVIHADDSYQPEHSYYTGKDLPEEAFAFYLNKQHLVSTAKVSLAFNDSSQKTGYPALTSEKPLPEGSPVYDENGNFLCLIASENECRTLPESFTHPVSEHWLDIVSDYPVVPITAGAVLVAALVAVRKPVLRVIIPMVLPVIYFISSFFISTPQGRCILAGGQCGTETCCCQ